MIKLIHVNPKAQAEFATFIDAIGATAIQHPGDKFEVRTPTPESAVAFDGSMVKHADEINGYLTSVFVFFVMVGVAVGTGLGLGLGQIITGFFR